MKTCKINVNSSKLFSKIYLYYTEDISFNLFYIYINSITTLVVNINHTNILPKNVILIFYFGIIVIIIFFFFYKNF